MMHRPDPWQAKAKKCLVYTILLLWSAVCIFPLYWLLITSFKDVAIIDGPPKFLPFWDFIPSTEAWRFILSDPNENLVQRAFNSLAIGLLSTLLTLIVGAMLLYGVTRFLAPLLWLRPTLVAAAIILLAIAALPQPPASRISALLGSGLLFLVVCAMAMRGGLGNRFIILTLIIATRILPPVAIIIPLYTMAQLTGTRDTLTALILVYTAVNLPLAVFLLYPAIGVRATEQEEAAQLDGASHFTIFCTVLLPMIKVNLRVIGFFLFLQCWNEYFFAVYLTADHALTLPPWMAGQLSMKEAQIGGEAEEWAHMSAATIAMALPALLSGFYANRVIGLTTPLVKWRQKY